MKYIFYIVPLIIISCNSKTEKDLNNNAENDSTFTDQPVQNFFEANITIETAEAFKLKNPDKHLEQDTLLLTMANSKYVIFPQGLLKIDNKISIQLKTDLTIERAFLYSDSTFLYLFFTETYFEGSTSWIQKIGKENFKTSFTNQITGFNLGTPIICNRKAYVTAIGFVGQIDLETGKYDWKKEDLYDNEKYAFNSFDTVVIEKNTVTFIADNNKNSVVVSKETGEIVELRK